MGGASVLVSRILKTIGIGESHIDEMVAPLLKSTSPTIGIYPSQTACLAREA